MRNMQLMDSPAGRKGFARLVLGVMAEGALRAGQPLERVRQLFPDFERERPALPPHAARADTAYFSFQGTFSATSGASQDFNLTLPSVAGNNPLTLKTFAFSGGANAAGQSVPAGGIDSILTLFNSSNVQIAQDDDASPSVPAGTRDSLLSPTVKASRAATLASAAVPCWSPVAQIFPRNVHGRAARRSGMTASSSLSPVPRPGATAATPSTT